MRELEEGEIIEDNNFDSAEEAMLALKHQRSLSKITASAAPTPITLASTGETVDSDEESDADEENWIPQEEIDEIQTLLASTDQMNAPLATTDIQRIPKKRSI